ncbi:MAG: DUF5908 family protein, partial [Acidobacteriota bacterium]
LARPSIRHTITMPFEIQEISIQMEVAGGPGPAAGPDRQDRTPAAPADVDAIVAQCVRAVLQILRESRER